MLMNCVRAENKKLHGSMVWIVFLLVPMISALYGTFNYLQNQGVLSAGWYDLFTQHTLFYAMFFYPTLAGIYASYLWRLEHVGHNWNLIMTVPVSPLELFLGKLAVAVKMSVMTQGWVCILYVLCGKFWAKLPGFPPMQILFWMMRGCLATIPIAAAQLLLSMVIRSFAPPILMALAGSVVGILAVDGGKGLLWVYSLMIMGMNSNSQADMLTGGMGGFLLSSVVYTVVLVFAAYEILKRRDVRA